MAATRFWSDDERADVEVRFRRYATALRDQTDYRWVAGWMKSIVGDPTVYDAVYEHVAKAFCDGRVTKYQLARLLAECHASTTNSAGKYFATVGMRLVKGRPTERRADRHRGAG